MGQLHQHLLLLSWILMNSLFMLAYGESCSFFNISNALNLLPANISQISDGQLWLYYYDYPGSNTPLTIALSGLEPQDFFSKKDLQVSFVSEDFNMNSTAIIPVEFPRTLTWYVDQAEPQCLAISAYIESGSKFLLTMKESRYEDEVCTRSDSSIQTQYDGKVEIAGTGSDQVFYYATEPDQQVFVGVFTSDIASQVSIEAFAFDDSSGNDSFSSSGNQNSSLLFTSKGYSACYSIAVRVPNNTDFVLVLGKEAFSPELPIPEPETDLPTSSTMIPDPSSTNVSSEPESETPGLENPSSRYFNKTRLGLVLGIFGGLIVFVLAFLLFWNKRKPKAYAFNEVSVKDVPTREPARAFLPL